MENKFVAVNQFDGAVHLLKIDMVTGDRKIVSADDLDESQVSFGLFESERESPDLESVALIATPEGPLLFLNDLKYQPKIGKTKIEVEDDGGISHFRVLHERQCIFGLFYKEKFGIGVHPYNNSREDIDFYYWLSRNIKNPKLYEAYTKEVKYVV